MTHHIDLSAITLDKGAHGDADQGVCLMEAVALFAHESHTDRPVCVSRVLIDMGISLNDRFPHAKRQLLKGLIPSLIGTADDGQDEARSYMALDWLIRTYTPAWLDLAGLTEEATALRDLRRIVDMVAAEAAGPVVRNAREKSAAAWDAARAAARAAARDAARDAAWDAARAAAGDAAWDAARAAAGDAARAAAWDAARAAARAAAWAAAWDAARAAAWDAARAAAWAALRPTVDQLQDSAIALYGSMVNPGATE